MTIRAPRVHGAVAAVVVLDAVDAAGIDGGDLNIAVGVNRLGSSWNKSDKGESPDEKDIRTGHGRGHPDHHRHGG